MKTNKLFESDKKSWEWACSGGSVLQLRDDFMENAKLIANVNGNAYYEHPTIDDVIVLVVGVSKPSDGKSTACGVVLDRYIVDNNGQAYNTVDILKGFKWRLCTTKAGRGYVVTYSHCNLYRRRKLPIEDVILAYAVNGDLKPCVKPEERGNYNIHHASYVWDLRVVHLRMLSKESHREYHHMYTHKSHQFKYTLDCSKPIPVLTQQPVRAARKAKAS